MVTDQLHVGIAPDCLMSHPCHTPLACLGASLWLLRSETPRDTLGAPRGNPDVSRIKAPWRKKSSMEELDHRGRPTSSSLLLPMVSSGLSEGDPWRSSSRPWDWLVAGSNTPCVCPSPPPSYIPGRHLLINRGSAGSAFPSSRLRQMAGRGGANLHLMNKYLLIPYDRPGPPLSGRNTEANKTDAVLSYRAYVEKKKKEINYEVNDL